MKGYVINISRFSYEKKKLTLFAIYALAGGVGYFKETEYASLSFFRWAGNVNRDGSKILGVGGQLGDLTPKQEACLISFNDLMNEYGFNYVEDGVEGFKEKSLAEAEKELKKTDQLIESLGVESGIISDLQSEIESLYGQLRSKSEEVGQLNVKLHETEKELSKSRISGAIIFSCWVIVVALHLFFEG